MSKYNLYLTYEANCLANIELPNGLTWEDLIDPHVRWGKLFYLVKGSEEEQSIMLNRSEPDIDYKWPRDVNVYPVDEDGVEDPSCVDTLY